MGEANRVVPLVGKGEERVSLEHKENVHLLEFLFCIDLRPCIYYLIILPVSRTVSLSPAPPSLSPASGRKVDSRA